MAKTKLSSAAVKSFFAQHGEKFGLGGAVLCLLFFAWSAWGRPTITQNEAPQTIKDKAARAIAHIDEGVIEPAATPPETAIAAANRSLSKLPETAVEITPYKPFVFQPFSKRGDPQLFPAESLIVSAGRGAIATMPKGQMGIGMQGYSEMSDGYSGGGYPGGSYPGSDYQGPGGDPAMQMMQGMAGKGKAGSKSKKGGGKGPKRSSGQSTAPTDYGAGMYSGTESDGYTDESGMYGQGGYGVAQGVGSKGGVSAPGAIPDGRRWAMVLATVPLAKQEQEFAAKLDEAARPDRVVQQFQSPFYGYIIVERAELNAAGEASDWRAIDVARSIQYQRKWFSVPVPEVADMDFTDPYLTMSLPPLLDKPWGKEANHPDIPENPIPNPTDPYGVPTGRQTDEANPDAETEEEEFVPALNDPFAVGAQGMQGYGSDSYSGTEGGYPGASGRRSRGGRSAMMSGASSGSAGYPGAGGYAGGSMYGGSMYDQGSMSGGSMYGEGSMYGASEKIIDKLLVRFFDFTVAPGKSYKYRIKLTVGNPNYMVGARYLQDAASSEIQSRETEWSEPSGVVSVPRDHQIFAMAADASRAQAKVGVVSWHPDLKHEEITDFGPVEAVKELTMDVGDVANITAETPVINFVKRTAEVVEKFPFTPNLLLADLRGGKQTVTDRPPYAPAEMLVMDDRGNLAVRHELEDSKAFEPLKERLETEEPSKVAPASEGGYPGGGYPGGSSSGMSMPGGGYPGGSSSGMSMPGGGYPGGSSSGMSMPGGYPGSGYPGKGTNSTRRGRPAP